MAGDNLLQGGTGNDGVSYFYATGRVYYDADGLGDGSQAVLFATVTAGTVLTAGDFTVFTY